MVPITSNLMDIKTDLKLSVLICINRLCVFSLYCIYRLVMLFFSPLFTASFKQTKELVEAVAISRWMESAVKLLEVDSAEGGWLCCSRCLLSDVNPAD